MLYNGCRHGPRKSQDRLIRPDVGGVPAAITAESEVETIFAIGTMVESTHVAWRTAV